MNEGIPVYPLVLFAAGGFAIGLTGLLTRRNLIIVFMSAEIMLNSANLLFVTFARLWGNVAGELSMMFVMAVAAAEAAIGLAIVIALHRQTGSIDVTDMKGEAQGESSL